MRCMRLAPMIKPLKSLVACGIPPLLAPLPQTGSLEFSVTGTAVVKLTCLTNVNTWRTATHYLCVSCALQPMMVAVNLVPSNRPFRDVSAKSMTPNGVPSSLLHVSGPRTRRCTSRAAIISGTRPSALRPNSCLFECKGARIQCCRWVGSPVKSCCTAQCPNFLADRGRV